MQQRLWLAHLRTRLGWSQEELAHRAKCDVSTISRCERGLHLPRIETRIAIGHALGVSTGIILACFRINPENIETLQSEYAIREGSSLTWGLVEQIEHPATEVREIDIELIELSAKQLAQMESVVGGGGLATTIGRTKLRWACQLLKISCSENLRNKRLAAVASLASVVAFIAFDSGRFEEAISLYEYAASLADESSDWHCRAAIFADLARVLIWNGNPDEGLTIAERALVRLDRLAPPSQAMVHTVRARAFAALKQDIEAEKAVGLADDAFYRGDPARQQPQWMNFYDEAQHCGDTAHALFDLALQGREHQVAVERFRYAVDRHDPEHPRSRAFSRGKLAILLLTRGSIENGIEVAFHAVDELRNIHSHRARKYLDELHDVAKQPRISSETRHLVEYMTTS